MEANLVEDKVFALEVATIGVLLEVSVDPTCQLPDLLHPARPDIPAIHTPMRRTRIRPLLQPARDEINAQPTGSRHGRE